MRLGSDSASEVSNVDSMSGRTIIMLYLLLGRRILSGRRV